MGSQESKSEQLSEQETEAKETVINESAPSTPILTPKDPRSPSVNIARTPLELILASKTSESDLHKVEDDNEVTKDDVVNVVLGIDPRSPTVEFNRTPIVVATVNKEKATKLKNKNLDNVRKNEIQTTPVSIVKKMDNIPPKLLESSPVAVVPNYNNKRKSFVGLLETNIDYTETDLDTVCQTKDTFNQSLPLELREDVPCNKLKDQMEALHSDSVERKSEEREDLDLNNLVENGLTIGVEKIPDEKIINVTAQVKDFDKKLTNLIYQDESDEDNKIHLRLTKMKENNRTPLSIRNSNEDTKKVQSRLKVSDKPRKSEGSKIPVLRNNLSKKIGVQCENTPPSKMEDHKYTPKISHWDADKTLVI